MIYLAKLAVRIGFRGGFFCFFFAVLFRGLLFKCSRPNHKEGKLSWIHIRSNTTIGVFPLIYLKGLEVFCTKISLKIPETMWWIRTITKPHFIYLPIKQIPQIRTITLIAEAVLSCCYTLQLTLFYMYFRWLYIEWFTAHKLQELR